MGGTGSVLQVTICVSLKIIFNFNFLGVGMTTKVALGTLSKEMVNIGWVIKTLTY